MSFPCSRPLLTNSYSEVIYCQSASLSILILCSSLHCQGRLLAAKTAPLPDLAGSLEDVRRRSGEQQTDEFSGARMAVEAGLFQTPSLTCSTMAAKPVPPPLAQGLQGTPLSGHLLRDSGDIVHAVRMATARVES